MISVNLILATVNILLKKLLNDGINDLVIITYRQLIAAIFLIPIAYIKERNLTHRLTARIVCYLFFSSLIGSTLMQYFFMVGLKYTTPTFTTAFINIVPVSTFILATLFRMERININNIGGRAKLLGAIIAIGGVLVLNLYKGMTLIRPSSNDQHNINLIDHSEHAKKWVIGTILLTTGSLMWSLWFLMQAGIGMMYPCQYSSTAALCLFSGVQSIVLDFAINGKSSSWIIKGKMEIASFIYTGMMGSGFCYVVITWCVKQKGPVFTVAFSPIIQVIVAIFDVSFLHGEIRLGCVLGSLLVIAGMYVLLWGKVLESKDSVAKIAPPAKLEDEESWNSRPIDSNLQQKGQQKDDPL
ncbi:WAT1-related protein At3g30340-like [Impatiens glandulifera]|uniref:WAT1-related protein At3g30340-like n=1 Tax=Impatiens glandulifera TaxID=253017 RepID=UPI001FB17DD7|nr:WAT1-related protein At3g30340-like [Impatiens glandulifera]